MDSELQGELTQLQSEWLEHLRRCEQSGLGLKAYAQREGLNHRRLYRFKRILTDKGVYREGEAVSARFVRARIDFQSEAVSRCRVRFRNGCVLELGGELNGVVLRELLHTVGTLP